MNASNQLTRNNAHLKGAFFSDLDRIDFINLTLNGVIDGLLSICASEEVENHISTQIYLYANNLQLVKDALEHSHIISNDNK